MIKNIPHESILEVWNVRATGIQGIGHYLILLNEGTHLCTCLLLINKGLLCRHFFRVGTYSQYATFHISMIPNRWYLNPDVDPNDLLQQYPPIPVCNTTQAEYRMTCEKNINFQHFFSLRTNSSGSYHSVKPAKAIYAELLGLSRKAIDSAIKSGLQQELSNILKTFIYDVQNKTNCQETDQVLVGDINNPDIIKHKGRPPKRLKSSIEKISHKEKRVLNDSTIVNVLEDNGTSNIAEITSDAKGRKCGRCKQYGHYAKTCQNVI